VQSFREAVINLDAVRANVRHLRSITGVDRVIAVVKANGYGHGALPVAHAALEGGAQWLGVADIDEALALRVAGISAPILAWLHDPDADFGPAVEQRIDIGISSLKQLAQAAAAASHIGCPAMVHIKLETGLSRNGVHESDWVETFNEAARLQHAGLIHVRGMFTHLSNASPADDTRANKLFADGLRRSHQAGLRPEMVHLSATAAAIRAPNIPRTTARLGIGIYGLSPFDDTDSHQLGLVPAMTLSARIAAVRRITAGTGVSYNYTYCAPHDTTVALIPLGYADGVPRAASGKAEVQIRGRRYPVRGRIAMDQFVVDLGDNTVNIGDTAVLFGDPTTGAPSASDWADWAGTINYEIVTRIGNRVVRRYLGNTPPPPQQNTHESPKTT
jgi:alanine racemase